MIKRGSDILLSPGEFHAEVGSALQQLSELAIKLQVAVPAGYEDFNRLKTYEFWDLWIACGARASRIDAMWRIEAGRLIAQALETGVDVPDASEPSV